jgi:hypothetical protein
MSVYTNQVKTYFYDPVHHSNKRSEFKLDIDKLYLSNFRLCNVGCKISNQASTIDYNKACGVKSLVRNIYLYDGNVIIDSLVKANRWLAFKSFQTSNDNNMDFKSKDHSGMGYVFQENSPIDALGKIREFNNTEAVVSSTDGQTPTGWLSLQDMFTFLGSVQYVSTSLFKNLRVVVEWESDVNVIFSNTSSSPVITPIISSVVQPLLVVDVIEDDKVNSEYLSSWKGSQWKAVENDMTVLGATTSEGTQTKKFKFNNFSNKTVSSILLQKEGTSSVSQFYKKLGSEVTVGEQIMVRVNNKNILPQPLVGANEKLALLHDSFGVMNTHTGCNSLNLYSEGTIMENPVQRQQHQAYVGLLLPTIEKVGALEIEYSRVKSANPYLEYNQELSLNLFGQVLKAIVVSKGEYQVVYL